jgi:hypothetical protein
MVTLPQSTSETMGRSNSVVKRPTRTVFGGSLSTEDFRSPAFYNERDVHPSGASTSGRVASAIRYRLPEDVGILVIVWD